MILQDPRGHDYAVIILMGRELLVMDILEYRWVTNDRVDYSNNTQQQQLQTIKNRRGWWQFL